MKKWLIRKTIIEKCLSCDDKAWVISEKCYCCYKKNLRNIKDDTTIPKWCPLEDYKEKVEGKEIE